MLANTSMRRPSASTTGSSAAASASARAAASASRRCSSASVAAASGSIVTAPASPSSASVAPSATESSAGPRPTISGIPSAPATIAAWSSVPPRAVAIPHTVAGSRSATAPGVSSSATTMPGSIGARASAPTSSASTRSATSRTSIARARQVGILRAGEDGGDLVGRLLERARRRLAVRDRGLGGLDQRGVGEQQRLRREDLGLARGQPRRGRGELLARGVERDGEPPRLLVRRTGDDGVEVELRELRPARRPDRQAAHRGHAAQHGARGRRRSGRARRRRAARGAARRAGGDAARRDARPGAAEAAAPATRRRAASRPAAPRRGAGGASPAAPGVRRVAEVVGRERAQRGEQLLRLRAARGDLELVALHGAEHRQPGHAAPVGGSGAAGRVADLDRRVVPGDELDDPPRRAQVQAEAIADVQPLDERLAVRRRGAAPPGASSSSSCDVFITSAPRASAATSASSAPPRERAAAATAPSTSGAAESTTGPPSSSSISSAISALISALPRSISTSTPVGRAHALDRGAHALGVRADRAVVEPARRLDGDLVTAHLARQLGRPFGQLRAVRDDDEVDRHAWMRLDRTAWWRPSMILTAPDFERIDSDCVNTRCGV